MRTRNSATPKSSPPPKRTLPARRTAAKTPTVYMPDSAPKLRETKRQAAIKAKQAMLNDTAPPPPKSQPEDEIDVNVGDDAGEVMPQASSSDKTVAKKGTKRTRGPAKGKLPATRKMKSAEIEEVADKNFVDGNVDVEMTENVIEIHRKEGDVTEKTVQMDGNNEDAPPVTVTSKIINKEAIEIDHVTVNNEGEQSDVCAKEEQEKETIETKNHIAVDFGESSDLQKNECYSEAETIARLTENEEKKGIAMEGGDYANSQPLVVNETIIVPVGKKIDCQPASTDAHTLVKAPGESTKAEGTANLNGDIMEGPDVQHDQDELKESKKINTTEVNGDAEELAAVEEDTLNEVAGKDKQLAGAFCDSGVRNSEVNDANCLDIYTMDNNNYCEDPEEFKKAEEDAKPGTNTDGMAGDGKKHEKENGQGSNTKDVVECFNGIKSCENQGVDVINDLGEKTDELKGEENLERNTRNFVVDSEKLEEEHREWTAVAKERRIKKEHEIFIRGIGGDTKEDDLRKVFEEIGEVAEVRLHKQSMLNKNKGYAFVRFADKEHVKRALIEIKEPIIGGLSCSIGHSEDDDTLFLGNVCNTWTKEAIKQKLKDYGVEGVENITLVPDAQREGFSRGFAFLEFSCHDDAAVAYQRLQKPDVIFGHAERTAKVAFAEPLRDPDPDVMLKVKTVFLDGLPSTCDEKYVREKVRDFGEIERIVLARNMTTAKRKDFGFVHFTTHEAAVACIDSINSIGLDDGNEKTKVKARLSNPLPKTQAVKDGMAGGFRIGFSSSGGASKPGRGLGRDGHLYRQGDSARGRGSYQRVYGQPRRGGFSSDYHHDTRFSSLVSGQGSRSGFRPRGELPVTGRPFILDRVRPVSVPGDAIHGMHREPFHFEGGYGRHHNQRQLDDSHAYGHGALGIKRPFHMIDLEPGYMEPSRRPRFNYADPPHPTAAPYSSHGTQIQDAQGPLPYIQPHNYHGPPANPRPHDYYASSASARPHDYYRPLANARPHGYNEPLNALPHVYNGPPNARPHGYNGPPSAGPHAYYGPPTSTRPPEYYGPPANIHAHSGPDVSKYLGGMRPPGHRGNPPYGGGFNY